MDCYQAKELIQEKLEGSVSLQEQHELEKHLVECKDCREFEHGLRKLDSLLMRQPLEEVPEGFLAKVSAAARRQQSRTVTFERRNLRVAAACIAAVLVAALLLPYFVSIPDTSDLKEGLVAMAPSIPDTQQIPDELTALVPNVSEHPLTFNDAVSQIKSSWQTFAELEISVPEISGTLILILAALAAAGVAFEALYLVLPYRRRA